jgi:hypothetical protein
MGYFLKILIKEELVYEYLTTSAAGVSPRCPSGLFHINHAGISTVCHPDRTLHWLQD